MKKRKPKTKSKPRKSRSAATLIVNESSDLIAAIGRLSDQLTTHGEMLQHQMTLLRDTKPAPPPPEPPAFRGVNRTPGR